MTTKKHFEELIRKIYSGTASVQEVREVFRKLRSNKEIDASNIPDNLHEEGRSDDRDFNNDLEKVWSKVERKINVDKSVLRLPIILRIAAAISIIVMAGFVGVKVYQTYSWTTYETLYGEILTITLNDGSTVVLNGNSILKVHKNLSVHKARDVYLSGEANFQVTKAMTPDARFVVHTKDLDVEVLGTRFNVNSRARETSVYLEEGRVKIRKDEFVGRDIYLTPGEKLEFNVGEQEVKLTEVTSESNEISWREGHFEFEELSLDEILSQITEPYNYSYRIDNPDLGERRFTLRIPDNDLEFAISVLEKLTGTSIADSNGELIVHEAENSPIE